MSVEAVKQFYAALERDEPLRQKFADLFSQHQTLDAMLAARMIEQEILPLAVEHGFLFSLAEMRRYEEELWHTGKELSESELQTISGGFGEFSAVLPFQGLFQKLFGPVP